MTHDGWTTPPPTGNNAHFESDHATSRILVGSIYGARTFHTTKDGHLTGVTYRKIWSPGITTAECWKVTGWDVTNVGTTPERPWKVHEEHATGRTLALTNGTTRAETERVFTGWHWELPDTGESGLTTIEPRPVYGNSTNPGHDLAECHCGLHGYFRGSIDFALDSDAVNGIVRAFGRMRIGPKGFRAQSAEVIALYVPVRNTGWESRPADHEHLRVGLRRSSSPLPPGRVEAISDRYPALPIYSDLDEMLALHELEDPRE